MNRIILKQKKKQEKEKEKKKEKPIRITQEVIRHRLMKHFQNHIGEENKTTSEEIFQIVMGYNSSMFDSFARFYWFNIIQKIMKKLRSENKCFIIKKNKGWFVLQSYNECKYYQGLLDNAVSKMKKAKTRAEEWVEQEKWKDMEIPPEEKPEAKPEEPPEEKVDNYKKDLKTKVIKLWKGEEKENAG